MRRRTLACAFLPLLLAGCGGSGHHSSSSSSSSTDTIGPQIALAWPARARAFGAPVAATAAQITFPGAGANGTDLTQVVSRPSAAAAVTQTYQLGVAVHPGKHLLRVDFLADAASTGAPLATANLNVSVTDTGALKTLDGKDLGTVAYGTNVTGLTIAADQTLEIGVTTDPVVTATTTGGVVALTPGSVTFTLVSGSGVLSLGSNGSVTGLAAGTATLTATADGVTSPAATVTVLPAPLVARAITLATNDFAFEPTAGRLLVATPSGTVQTVRVADGAVTGTIAVGSDPSVLALSDDGTTLWVGLRASGAVRKVDLTTNTAGLQFTIPNTGFGGAGYATDLGVQPGHPATIAVETQEFGSSGNNGPEIFDDGVKRANGLGIYEGTRLLWTAVDRLVAWDNASTDDALRGVTVDASGATQTQSVPSGLNSFSTGFALAGGRLYDRSGVVFDAASLTRVGSFDLNLSASYAPGIVGPAVDLAAKRAYFVQIDGGTVRVLSFDTDTFALVGSRRVSGVTNPTDPSGTRPNLAKVGSGLVLRLPDQLVFMDDLSGL